MSSLQSSSPVLAKLWRWLRRLLKLMLTLVLTLVVLVALLAVWSVLVEPRWVAKRTFDVPVPGWQGPAGLKVVVASDWHIAQQARHVMTVQRAAAIVRDINATEPDVVLLPGDFIFGRGEDGTTAGQIASVLGQLKARHGVYAVLGNHDWWTNGPKLTEALQAAGVRVLHNESVRLPGTSVWVVGIGDRTTGHSDPAGALRGLPANAQTLTFMHDPASARLLPRGRGLTVAAHTHGGQVWLPGYGSIVAPHGWPRRQTHGWVRIGRREVYITSGLGVSIYPVRFNMRPEWVMFTLKPAVRPEQTAGSGAAGAGGG
ncbi:metallophosphoesterase [Roseateles sp. SL47]|uniref:metallophosphoesterase n=1 Tax=Roseateles sp. SL47 TaxID=2995138 RepID=UPI002271696A|nr:metallophosphoesterase [Roseateles sp. SL47]WAC74811.1 metallophosphoesterase [Roseateles sp. SL47]